MRSPEHTDTIPGLGVAFSKKATPERTITGAVTRPLNKMFVMLTHRFQIDLNGLYFPIQPSGLLSFLPCYSLFRFFLEACPSSPPFD